MTNEEFLEKITLEGEEWKGVPGFEDTYMCSNFGRVVVLNKYYRLGHHAMNNPPKILKPIENSKKYHHQFVNIYRNNKRTTRYIHRLVATLFIPNPHNYPQVEHLDCNPKNNHVSNLRWCTASMNMSNPITKETLRKLRKDLPFIPNRKPIVQLKNGIVVQEYGGICEVDKTKFNLESISHVCHGRYKSSGGFQWMFKSDYENLVNKSKNSTPQTDNENSD